jgi:Zn-finger protein
MSDTPPKDYPSPESGEWVQPTRRGYLMQCCDCGLVHRLDFKLVQYANGKRRKIRFRVDREDAETARVRKARGIRLREVDE